MKKYQVNFNEAVFILITLLLMIGTSIIGFGIPAHIAILLAIGYLLLFAVYKKFSWDFVHDALIEGVASGIIPMLIFILIGALISVWIAVGTIPTIMVLGFSFLSVKFFIPTVFIVCGIVGGAVGSSFTTISTIGIAFLGMGSLIGVDPVLTTGAIVSGAFLGNSISPLSDTVNLAAAISEVDLFDHLKNTYKTAIPAAILSFGYFLVVGLRYDGALDSTSIHDIVQTLNNNFTISFMELIPLALLFVCAWKKIPAIPTLLLSICASLILLFFTSTHFSFGETAELIQNGVVSHTGNTQVDELLSRGGIQSMMWSVSLIILALALGGLLVKMEIIDCLLQRFETVIDSRQKLIFITMMSSIGINVLIGEQYLSIILPGKSFIAKFKEKKVPLTMLSRGLNDAGSVVNPLIPWGVSGVFISGTLGIATMDYLPYAVFCFALPLLSFFLTIIGKKKTKE
ncbi:Na+/H+ antiporter NhaC [Enterococcus haemoperoxidus ATCC BAA-382]|uniref:Na+/H+ antiporter NhaC n=1 Tax=Enterococcus haemoperoxidus ATCC BAA-382 TaxID=1158608 RepID=R2T3B2_9ENTE|nr:Na+/H+ antiporter NhaC [Enterococcus haemoperoxidus]EOH99466.1 Na+/H+ antiporter NhaC [Enterococcus haemoperoxidus ATCC BAA-382]EOT62793.1 Na+/H+ antiporter NhaC [Enterococcus haemoperoxidus ATCC BAA-382]OJG52224.1 Na+/H+ antiporter NhaC [Enterococcus haemoperoxidus]